MFCVIAVAIRSAAVLPRKAVPANGSGKPAGAGNGYRENGYSQCENALGGGGVGEETLLQKGPSPTKYFLPPKYSNMTVLLTAEQV